MVSWPTHPVRGGKDLGPMKAGGRGMVGDMALFSLTLNLSASTAELSWGSGNLLLVEASHNYCLPTERGQSRRGAVP